MAFKSYARCIRSKMALQTKMYGKTKTAAGRHRRIVKAKSACRRFR